LITPETASAREYLFFIEFGQGRSAPVSRRSPSELASHTEILKIFGSYSVLPIELKLEG
jgi:prephenate dehydratase